MQWLWCAVDGFTSAAYAHFMVLQAIQLRVYLTSYTEIAQTLYASYEGNDIYGEVGCANTWRPAS